MVASPPLARLNAMCLELLEVIDAHWTSRTSWSGALSQDGTVLSQSYVEPAATSEVDQLRPYGAGVGLCPSAGVSPAIDARMPRTTATRRAPRTTRLAEPPMLLRPLMAHLP